MRYAVLYLWLVVSHTAKTELCCIFLQADCDEDDDLQTLLQDMSTSPTLHESTDLIWNSNEEVGGNDMRPGSSCSGSILQPESPVGESQVGHSWKHTPHFLLPCLLVRQLCRATEANHQQ